MNKKAGAVSEDSNQAFYDKAGAALRDLFQQAKAKNELHFAMALMPELRGMQDAGWNTAEEAARAADQFTDHINSINEGDPMRVRVALAFYLQLAEGSGFYEMPKKMMLTVEGRGNNIIPFQKLVKKHNKTGRAIDPNANAIMKDLMGHAYELGLSELSDVFKEAFDGDLRNAIAHADYIIAPEGLRIRRRNGGLPRVIPWAELDLLISRGANLFRSIQEVVDEHVRSYDPPKTINARLNESEPLVDWTIYFLPQQGAFGVVTGTEPPESMAGANSLPLQEAPRDALKPPT
ncbi:hypothetical protein [Bradyrhizobium elkanii]|uniref:hypothetical protein n=1 Tax=Bradyrhizobium elkanii TaxID=29448 RepID=UPI001AE61241|nr:hypothetical protein [Bradyrhizobium elkanii]MBP2431499.1 hypothetical protein [Bradyrhizobium elkanii]WLA91220.1 hypothetical protein QNJ96_40940 [Bradyrhizobium elkanii]